MKRPSKLYLRLKRAGCHAIGDYERLAGLSQDAKTRRSFWNRFKQDNTQAMIDAGVAVLLHRIARRLKQQQFTLLTKENGRYKAF